MAHLPEDKPSLKHLAPGYDPIKAHEYYIRTRRLHPRARGAAAQPVGGRTGRIVRRPPILAKPAAAQLLRQRATARAAVTSLESKLVELKNVLSRKQAALNRDKKLNAKPTATNKAKAARESKKYRQTHQQQLKNKAKTRKSGGHSLKNVVNNPKSGSIKEVEAAIQVVEKALTAAKARVIALG